MKFNLKNVLSKKIASDCLILGVFENKNQSEIFQELDKTSQGYLSNLIKSGDLPVKTGQTLLLHQVPHLACKRLLLIGCGKQAKLSERDFRKIITSSFKALSPLTIKNAFSFLTILSVENREFAWKIQQIILLGQEVFYQFNQYKSEKAPAYSLQDYTLFIETNTTQKELKFLENSLQHSLAIAAGVEFTKNLANLPSNVCTPTYLANQAKKLAKTYSAIKVKILEEKTMKKLGMGALLAVSKGSSQPPKLICLKYKGGKQKQAPIAFVGKGITFDTGGISLKTAEGMVGMKYDMCGAATVLGVMQAAAEMSLPLNLVGVIAAAENMPDGNAVKPEDIVTSLSGQTIEILNTDAEGRLVLSDALTYCERFKPDTVIDIATLTGAVVIALGIHASGLISNHDPLATELLTAGKDCYDRAWQMPLWDEYQDQLKSQFADMTNVGGRSAGVITAACFLSRFTKKFHWAHLDVAGTAAMMMGGVERYATGRPVPMLMQFLLNRCKMTSPK